MINIMDTILVLVLFVSLLAFAMSLIGPEVLLPLFKGKLQKNGMRWLFGLLIPVLFILIGVTADSEDTQKNTSSVIPAQEIVQLEAQSQIETQEQIEQIEQKPAINIEVKEEKATESIPFKSKTENDSTLEEGKRKVIQEGTNGIKEFVYEVTYTDGKETSRKLISQDVKNEPVDEITAIGTKKSQPVYVAPASCGEDYYRNVDGNCVHRPSSNPAGASAKCRDGSYSYSQNRRGTCSGHGGVSVWY